MCTVAWVIMATVLWLSWQRCLDNHDNSALIATTAVTGLAVRESVSLGLCDDHVSVWISC